MEDNRVSKQQGMSISTTGNSGRSRTSPWISRRTSDGPHRSIGLRQPTLLRLLLNRGMNDLIDGTRVEGRSFRGEEHLRPREVDPVEIRRRIGMVFQNRTRSPKSISTISPYGPNWPVSATGSSLESLVEQSLRQAGSCGTR